MNQLDLTTEQHRLVDTGRVLLVDKRSEEIPESERNAVWRGFGGNFGNKGLACTILRDDGIVLIVTEGDVEPEVMRHEFIHAAQCFASEEVMQTALDTAAAVGEALVVALREVVAAHPELEHSHRDLSRTEAQWRMQAAGSAIVAPFPTFQLYQDLYPTKETAAIATEVLGFDYKQGAYAAMTAFIARESGYKVDPASSLGRELVAYTFEQLDHDAIDALMSNGAASLELAAAEVSRSY
ncbi:hypothetical protein G6L37_07010 [Agrobacterium rubi]|nr:hypothetical protein [Agrobacterium rubi]NTF25115.1 hypothetical protein [Agrobacterium rubi]